MCCTLTNALHTNEWVHLFTAHNPISQSHGSDSMHMATMPAEAEHHNWEEHGIFVYPRCAGLNI